MTLFIEPGIFKINNLALQGSKALEEFYTNGVFRKTQMPLIQSNIIELKDELKAKSQRSIVVGVNKYCTPCVLSDHDLSWHIKVTLPLNFGNKPSLVSQRTAGHWLDAQGN